jgi:hypothetical protein
LEHLKPAETCRDLEIHASKRINHRNESLRKRSISMELGVERSREEI